MAAPTETGYFNINEGITHTMSQTPGKTGGFDVKNKEKASLNVNNIGKGFGSRNTFRWEAFSWTSKSLKVLQVKFYCG